MADEGLDWLLELNADMDEAVKASKILDDVAAAAIRTDKALGKTEAALGGVGQKMARSASAKILPKGVTQQIPQVTQAAGGLGQTLGALPGPMAAATGGLLAFGAAAGAGALAIGAIGLARSAVSIFLDLGEAALRAAGDAQRTRSSFRLLLGEAPGDELLDYIDDIAEHTEFTDGALKGFANQLARAGFSGEGLKRALGATIDLAAQAQDKVAGASEAVALLSKMNLKGGVSDRELVSAKIDPQKFYSRVAKQTGIGLKEVEKKIQQGGVKNNILVEALYSELVAKMGTKSLGQAGVSMSGGFLSQLEKAKDLIPNLFEEMEKSGGFKSISESLKRFNEALSPKSETGQTLIKGLERMMNAFAKMLTEVDIEKLTKTLLTLFEALPGFVEATAAALGKLVKVAQWFIGDEGAAARGGVAQGIAGLASGNPVSAAAAIGGQVLDQGGAWVFGKIAGLFESGGSDAAAGFTAGMLAGAPAMAAAAASASGSAAAASASELGIRSPSTVFDRQGRMSGEGWANGLERSLPGMTGAVEAAMSTLAPSASLAGGGGGAHFEAHITVNIGGGAPGEARETGEQVAMGVQRAVQVIFEKWAAEGAAT